MLESVKRLGFLEAPPEPWETTWTVGSFETNGTKIEFYPMGTWCACCRLAPL